MIARDDDADWLEALAGRARPGTEASTLLEATLLRSAARRWPAAIGENALLPPEEAVLARARAAAAAPRRRFCAGCAERWRRWVGRAPRLGLAAAALALALIVVPWLPGPGPDRDPGEPVLRGDHVDGVWLLRDAEPERRRDRLAAELEEAGLRVLRYRRLGRYGLEAEVPPPVGAAASAALARHALVPAPDGIVRIEVEGTGR